MTRNSTVASCVFSPSSARNTCRRDGSRRLESHLRFSRLLSRARGRCSRSARRRRSGRSAWLSASDSVPRGPPVAVAHELGHSGGRRSAGAQTSAAVSPFPSPSIHQPPSSCSLMCTTCVSPKRLCRSQASPGSADQERGQVVGLAVAKLVQLERALRFAQAHEVGRSVRLSRSDVGEDRVARRPLAETVDRHDREQLVDRQLSGSD